MAGELTRFAPGVSGNPGGNVRNQAVSQLARRYTIDAVRALVEVVRLPTAGQHIGAKVTAAVKLIEIGHPGLAKGISGDTDLLAMHLLAVQQIVPPDQNSVLNPTSQDEDQLLVAAERPGMLPSYRDDLPDDALPLWDAYRVQRDAPKPADDADDAKPGWEPIPWREP